MHFVDQVYLKLAAGGFVLHIVQQLPGILDLGARRGVDLKQVNIVTLLNFLTRTALPTRVCTLSLFTVQAFRKYAGNRGFPHAPGTGEQVSMVQPVVLQCIGDGRNHVLLPY